MSYEAVIFDLDGTLLDTLDDLGDGTNLILSRHGFPVHETTEYRQMVGRGLYMLMTLALPEDRRDEPTIRSLHAELDTFLCDHPVTKTHPYPGIPETLTALAASGIPMGILTNKPDALTQIVVSRLLANWSFVGVQGQREGIPRKPDPTAAVALAEEMRSSPSHTVFVGDSDVDIQTALAAGMVAVGVEWGFRGRKELETAGAERVISSPSELLALFGTP